MHVNSFVKIGLNAFLPVGCTGLWDGVLLIWKLQHKPSSSYALQRISIFVQIGIANFKKMLCKGVAKARGRVLQSVMTLQTDPAAGSLQGVWASFRPLLETLLELYCENGMNTLIMQTSEPVIFPVVNEQPAKRYLQVFIASQCEFQSSLGLTAVP